ncbi:MAG: exosortase/archaeosortase family protein [Candidatus Bathyarchaeota archaeon]|nr:exosortase/archaeosortase family protein [Candidatus Bathyarchaeota archaeon]
MSSPSDFGSLFTQHRLAVALKFSVISVVILLLYAQDLGIIFTGALSDEASFHILAVPILFAYLLFRKRKMVNAVLHQPNTSSVWFTRNFSTLAGAALFATAILTYWFGSYTFTPLEYHMVTLPFVATALVLMLFNLQALKQVVLPIAFLFFLTPPPAEILFSIGSLLSNLSAAAANALANLFGLASVLSNSYGSPIITLTRPDSSIMTFSVDVACSGIYSLIGFVIFALFIAYITRGKLRNKFAILLMGIPLIIVLNIIRITTILFIGYYYGDELALQVFHTVGATVLMFIGTLVLLGITEKFFKKPKPPPPCPTCTSTELYAYEESCPQCGKLKTFPKTKLNRNDLTKIVCIALVVAVLLSIQAPVFALTQGPAEIEIQTPTGTQGNTLLLPQVQGYTLSYVFRDTAFEQLSGEDASLVYAYGSANGTFSTVWVAVELATSLAPLHRWETCLVNYPIIQGYQPTVRQLDLRDIQTQENPPIVSRYFAFQYFNNNQTQVVLYWYQTAKFNVNGTTQLMNLKMSLVEYPQSPEAIPASEAHLLIFAKAIHNYWQPIQTWTRVALIVSQNGLVLSALAGVALMAILFYGALLNRRSRLFTLRLYSKISPQNHLLVNAVVNAQHLGDSSTRNVAAEYQKLTDLQISETSFTQMLIDAEKAGLVKKNLLNVDDHPVLNWACPLADKKSLLHWFGL